MHGRFRSHDGVSVERPWRRMKQEALFLEDTKDGRLARRVIKDWTEFHDAGRSHAAL